MDEGGVRQGYLQRISELFLEQTGKELLSLNETYFLLPSLQQTKFKTAVGPIYNFLCFHFQYCAGFSSYILCQYPWMRMA